MKRIAFSIAALLACSTAHAEDSYSLNFGANYSSGDYGGDTTTEIWSLPLSVSYSRDNWTFGASVPWLRVSGDVGILPGLGVSTQLNQRLQERRRRASGNHTPNPTPTTQTDTVSGIGDLDLSLTYSVANDNGAGLDITGRYKVATANEKKSLGTGADDYGLSINVHKEIGERMQLFGGAGYTVLGNSDLIEKDSIVDATIGASWSLRARDELGVSYSWSKSPVSGLEASRDVGMSYTLAIGESGSVQFNLGTGLSDNSANWNAGIAYGHTF